MESRPQTTAAVCGLHFAVAGRQGSLLLALLFVAAAVFLPVAERPGPILGKKLDQNTRYILLVLDRERARCRKVLPLSHILRCKGTVLIICSSLTARVPAALWKMNQFICEDLCTTHRITIENLISLDTFYFSIFYLFHLHLKSFFFVRLLRFVWAGPDVLLASVLHSP
jgi:hypothetical protein